MTRTTQELLTDIHGVTAVYFGKHFVYTSNKHGDGYVNYRQLGAADHEPLLQETVVHLLRKTLTSINVSHYRNILAVGPETMGAQMVKQIRLLTEAEMPYNIDTRIFVKDPNRKGEFIWDADPERVLNEDTLVLWLDDLLNLTSTFQKTAPLIYHFGAQIHSIAVIGDRSTATVNDLKVRRIVTLEKFSLAVFEEDACPLCNQRQPIVIDLGHGSKWQDRNPNYVGGFTTAR